MYETLSQVAARFRIPRLADIAPNDPRFSKVDFMVAADEFSYQALRANWSDRLTWESDDATVLVGLGILIGRNVTVNVRFAQVNGGVVMFYSGNSDLVDYKMIETFENDVRALGKIARPDRLPAGKTDATNFQDYVDFCQSI